MADFSIGLSGLQVAQKAIDLVGTNLSNAGTVGYHRQELLISPAASGQQGMVLASGVTMSVRQIVDRLIERQILQQQTSSGGAGEALGLMQTVETTFGEVDNDAMSKALDNFFGSLKELASQPDSLALREQALSAGQQLADEFRSRSAALVQLSTDVRSRAGDLVTQANEDVKEIAALNMQIKALQGQGASTNELKDRRDQVIKDLAELMQVRVDERSGDSGELRLYGWDNPLVAGSRPGEICVGPVADGRLGIAVGNDVLYRTDLAGGKLGELLDLANNVLPDIQGRLDALATAIMSQINGIQVQGIGSQGPMTELAGEPVSTGVISGWSAQVQDGHFCIRVTDKASGEVTREEIAVDPAVDTAANIASRLDALDHISAWMADGKLHIQAQDGYAFDFTAALLPTAATTAAADMAVQGLYTGSADDTITITAQGAGQIGVTDGLKLEVRNGAGELLGLFNVGLGYAAGDAIDLGNGIKISLGAQTLADGDEFTIDALTASDTSGFLAAAGLNTIFEGTGAADMAVRQDLLDHPELLALSRGSAGNDAAGASLMGMVGDRALAALGGRTAGDYYRTLVTDIGRQVAAKQAASDSTEAILRQLNNQRDAISGVDINQESARLLVFQQMYQAVAKFINAQNQTNQYLMEIM